MHSLLKLEECKPTPEKVAERDIYLKELESNNAEIRRPSEHFWEVVRKFSQEVSLPPNELLCNSEDLRKRIEEDTDFRVGRGENSPLVDYHINPGFMPDDMVANHLNSDIGNYTYLITWSGLRREKVSQLIALQERNSELLVSLCKIDLEGRLGTDFRGMYAHAGLDVDLVYRLGGEWLVVEPHWEKRHGNYKEDVIRGTNFGKKALAEGRIRLATPPVLQEIKIEPDFEWDDPIFGKMGSSGKVKRVLIEPEKLDKMIANYVPDVVLIKVPTPGAEYEELLAFYERFLKKDTLIIVDSNLQSPNLNDVTDIDGVDDLTSLRTERMIYPSGGSICHFVGFRMYILKPNRKE